jgi:hypothetical protein
MRRCPTLFRCKKTNGTFDLTASDMALIGLKQNVVQSLSITCSPDIRFQVEACNLSESEKRAYSITAEWLPFVATFRQSP